jgi:hypothetical protein
VKDPRCLAKTPNRILGEAEDGDHQDKIEGSVGKWKGFRIALDYSYTSGPGDRTIVWAGSPPGRTHLRGDRQSAQESKKSFYIF